MNVIENRWVTVYACSMYFPMDHSFAILKDISCRFSPFRYIATTFWEITDVYVYVSVTGNIIEPLLSSYVK